jgi:glycine betaine/proline transport system substrate-binding protein
MNRTRRVLLCMVVLVFGFGALAACGDDDDKPAATPGSTSPRSATTFTGSITLAVNPWDGSAANAAVAKVILESKGMTVKLRDIDENAVWPALDSGSIDANLEVWPSGHAQDIKTYITHKKSVIDGGLIGPTGHIGWYIPKFVADEHPEYTSWEGLKSQDAAKYFATAETGDQGQFLLGDPSYVSYDADIIKNLDLPFKVVTGGGEAALITAIDTAFKDHKPLLFYFYQPQWANKKYDLVTVKLPEVTPECTESAAGQGKDGKYACDYPTDKLLKAISAKLETKNPAAFNFLKKMQWSDDDQNTVTTYKNEDGLSIEDAAKKWVDENEAKWQEWLT